MTKDEVYEILRQNIVTNTIPPGEILNEKDLMGLYGIGRSPLREVLFRLHEEELLKSLPRLGYLVTAVDMSEVRELMELRRELEGFAGTLAADRIDHEHLEGLKAVIQKAEKEKPAQDSIQNIADYFDTRFHNILYEATQNRKLNKVLRELHTIMLRIWFHIGFNTVEFQKKTESLQLVIQALEARDPAKTRKALEDHVDLYANQMKEKFLTVK